MNTNTTVWTGEYYKVEAWVDTDGKRIVFFKLNKTIPSQRHCANRLWVTEGVPNPKWWKRQQSIEVAMEKAIEEVSGLEKKRNRSYTQRKKLAAELEIIIEKRNRS